MPISFTTLQPAILIGVSAAAILTLVLYSGIVFLPRCWRWLKQGAS